MTEPKYNEDVVNLGYLKRALGLTDEQATEIYKYISKHYGSKPQPPYYSGDTWIDGDIVYTCIHDRLVGTYQDSDWVTESGAKREAERKSKVFLRQPSNYSIGDMWILQSDTDHRAGKRGEILITTAGRREYDPDDWVNMLGYGTIRSINEVANNINDALIRLGLNKESGVLTIYYADEIPANAIVDDLWYVTEDVDNYVKGIVYKFNGTDWEELDDELAVVAFDEANQARLVEDGKIQSFYSTTQPTDGLGAGDIWTNTSNNKLFRYNGTNWVAVYDTNISEIRIDLDTVTEKTTILETDLGSITGRVTEVETTTRTISDDVGVIQSDIVSLSERTGTLEIDSASIKSRVTATEQELVEIKDTSGIAQGHYIYLPDSSDQQVIDIKQKGETNQATTILPEEYTQVEYIEGDGTQYINTGITPSNTFGIEMEFQYTQVGGTADYYNMLGCADGTNAIYLRQNDGGSSLARFGANTKNLSTTLQNTNKHIVKWAGTSLTIDSTSYTFNSATFTVNKNLLLFALNPSSGSVAVAKNAKAKLYYCKIYNGFTLNRYYIPCKRNSDNKVGLYDLINNQFYTSISASDFTAGSNTNLPSPIFPIDIKNVQSRNIFNKELTATSSGANKTVLDTGVRATYSSSAGTYKFFAIELGQNELLGKKIAVSSIITPSASNKGYINIYMGSSASPGITSTGIYLSSTGSIIGTLPYKFADSCDRFWVLFYANRTGTGASGDYVDYTDVQIEFDKATSYVPYNNIQIKTNNKNLINASFYSNELTDTRTPLQLDIWAGNTGNYQQQHIVNANNINSTGIKSYTFTATDNYIKMRIKHNGSTRDLASNYDCNIKQGETYTLSLNITGIDPTTVGGFSYESVQVEKGSTKTNYIEHEEQTYNFPLSEGQKLYEGSFFADNGLHNVRNQVVFNGSQSESWTLVGAINSVYRYSIDLVNNKIGYKKAICSHFPQTDKTNFSSINEVCQSTHPSDHTLNIFATQSTLSSFKTWLSNNPITVEYELATEEVISYTQAQEPVWQEISNLNTYKPVTHIYSDAYAEIEYIKDNGLDIYETRPNANKTYTEISNKFAQQEITNESITNTVSDTVTKLNNNYLTKDQVQGQIDTVSDNVETISSRTTALEQTSTSLQLDITNIQQNGVSKVQTTMGYTFDDEGLKINKTNAETGTIIDESAIRVIDKTGGLGGNNLLYAGYVKDGNTDYPDYIGQTIVYSKNMIVDYYGYLTVSDSRFQAYENPEVGGHGTGVFGI